MKVRFLEGHRIIRSGHRYFVLILASAILLRLIWIALVPVVPLSDGLAYDQLARNIVDLGMYGASMDKPSAYWPVGTPALYALLYWIFGFHYLPIAFFNVLLVIVIITCTVRLARRSLATWPTVDTVAGMMLAVWPTLIMYVTILASELAFMAAMLLAIDLWTNKDRTIWIKGSEPVSFSRWRAMSVHPRCCCLSCCSSVNWLSGNPSGAASRCS